MQMTEEGTAALNSVQYLSQLHQHCAHRLKQILIAKIIRCNLSMKMVFLDIMFLSLVLWEKEKKQETCLVWKTGSYEQNQPTAMSTYIKNYFL